MILDTHVTRPVVTVRRIYFLNYLLLFTRNGDKHVGGWAQRAKVAAGVYKKLTRSSDKTFGPTSNLKKSFTKLFRVRRFTCTLFTISIKTRYFRLI